MTESEKKVLKGLYGAYSKKDGSMGRMTSKKLNMSREEFQSIIRKFMDYGFLPDAFEVRGGKGNSSGWLDQGNELSEEAIKIAKEL